MRLRESDILVRYRTTQQRPVPAALSVREFSQPPTHIKLVRRTPEVHRLPRPR